MKTSQSPFFRAASTSAFIFSAVIAPPAAFWNIRIAENPASLAASSTDVPSTPRFALNGDAKLPQRRPISRSTASLPRRMSASIS